MLGINNKNMSRNKLPVLYHAPAPPKTMKTIVVADAASGNHTQVTIHPGTTAADVLQQAGFIQDYTLTRNREGESIPMDENLYESVPDGAKVWASTPVDFGTGRSPLLAAFYKPPIELDYLAELLKGPPLPEPIVAIPPSRRIRVARRIEVKPSRLPYWEEKGWTRSKRVGTTVYEGYFYSPRHKVKGRIEEGFFTCKIWMRNPPRHTLQRHPTWGCFRPRSDDWWEIHHHGCRNASNAILQVERTLNEAEAEDYARLY